MLKVGDQVQILPSAVIVGIPEIFIGHTAVVNAVYSNNLISDSVQIITKHQLSGTSDK